MAAVRLSIAPGWKTYWRSPGEVGIPPVIALIGSSNVASAQLSWPVPIVFDDNGFRSIGYEGTVVLPLRVEPETMGGHISLKGRFEIGVCADVCVPVSLPLSANLTAADVRPDPAIRAALADRPMTAGEAGATDMDCRFATTDEGLRVELSLAMPSIGREEVAAIEIPDPDIWVSQAWTDRVGDRITARADVVPTAGAPAAVDRGSIRLTLIGDGQAVEVTGCR